jgi:phage shock protein A
MGYRVSTNTHLSRENARLRKEIAELKAKIGELEAPKQAELAITPPVAEPVAAEVKKPFDPWGPNGGCRPRLA